MWYKIVIIFICLVFIVFSLQDYDFSNFFEKNQSNSQMPTVVPNEIRNNIQAEVPPQNTLPPAPLAVAPEPEITKEAPDVIKDVQAEEADITTKNRISDHEKVINRLLEKDMFDVLDPTQKPLEKASRLSKHFIITGCIIHNNEISILVQLIDQSDLRPFIKVEQGKSFEIESSGGKEVLTFIEMNERKIAILEDAYGYRMYFKLGG